MAKPGLSVEAILRHLQASLGEVEGLRPMSEGEESQAFTFRHGNDDLVVRINSDRLGFDKDRFVYEAFAEAALPIPEVLDIGWIDDNLAWCVSRLVPGITLQAMEPDQLQHVMAPAAAALNAIAAVDLCGAPGFGPFDARGRGRCATWRDYLVKIWWPNAHESITIQKVVSQDRIDRYFNELAVLALSCPEEKRLVHGDFGSNNVLVMGDKITGVIDWSEAMYGDPLYDVANILFWRSWLPCMEIQARFLEDTIPDDIDIRRRLKCYQLRIGIDEIHAAALDSRRRLLKWAVPRCDEILAIDLWGQSSHRKANWNS